MVHCLHTPLQGDDHRSSNKHRAIPHTGAAYGVSTAVTNAGRVADP
jgi:hypothetical protein